MCTYTLHVVPFAMDPSFPPLVAMGPNSSHFIHLLAAMDPSSLHWFAEPVVMDPSFPQPVAMDPNFPRSFR